MTCPSPVWHLYFSENLVLDYWIIMYANISGSAVIRLREGCTRAHILIGAGVVLTKHISPHPKSPFCCTSVWFFVVEANSGYCPPRKKPRKTYYSADRGAASPAAQNYINELKKIYQGWTAVIMVIECPLQSVVRSHVKVKTSFFGERDALQCVSTSTTRWNELARSPFKV